MLFSLIATCVKPYKDWGRWMLAATQLGDPRHAFLLYFPLAYFCSAKVGIRVIWVAATSEWLNAVLKWLLFGHRPYWWIPENGNFTRLQQFSVTCETGPGSPSGHAMVTASVCFVLVTALVNSIPKYNKHRGLLCGLCWTVYGLLLIAVCVSRLFIATHFPHQVILGVLIGIMTAMFGNKLPLSEFNITHYFVWTSFLLTSGMAQFQLMKYLGLNPLWSWQLAQKWCQDPTWIHLDTTPFYALVRDSSMLLGLGAALWLKNENKELNSGGYRLLGAVLSLVLLQSSEGIRPPQTTPEVFYVLSYLKNFILPMLVVNFVSHISSWIVTKFSLSDSKTE